MAIGVEIRCSIQFLVTLKHLYSESFPEYEDPETNIETFEKRDKSDIKEKGLGKVIEMSDFKIDNNKDFGNLFTQVEEVLSKITGQDILRPRSSK